VAASTDNLHRPDIELQPACWKSSPTWSDELAAPPPVRLLHRRRLDVLPVETASLLSSPRPGPGTGRHEVQHRVGYAAGMNRGRVSVSLLLHYARLHHYRGTADLWERRPQSRSI